MQSVSPWIHSEDGQLLHASTQCAQRHTSIVQIQPWKDNRKGNVYSGAYVWGELKIATCSAEEGLCKEGTVKIQLMDWKL